MCAESAKPAGGDGEALAPARRGFLFLQEWRHASSSVSGGRLRTAATLSTGLILTAAIARSGGFRGGGFCGREHEVAGVSRTAGGR
jgi:hypothetical protein